MADDVDMNDIGEHSNLMRNQKLYVQKQYEKNR